MTSSSRRTPPSHSNRASRSRPPRPAYQPTFLERNRARLLLGLGGVALVAVSAVVFLNATSPAYACSTQWTPAVTPPPAPGATPRLGYVQDDLGRDHLSAGPFVRYALCPPASGKHLNATGEGPIRPGAYGPDDQATPQGWIHNLEHGGLVVLYRCVDGDSACGEAGQQAFRDFSATFPNSPVCNLPSVAIVARFDEMAWPYAALVWGQVLPMESFDGQLVRDFFAQQGERANPEQLCARPTPTPAPAPTPAPTPASTPAPTPTPASS